MDMANHVVVWKVQFSRRRNHAGECEGIGK